MRTYIFHQLQDIKAWQIKLYIMLFSVLLSEIITSTMGLLLKGYVPVDYLLTGLVTSFFVAFLMVTILLQFREQFVESQLQLKTIIDTEPECVKLMAADGTLLQMNRAGLMLIEADSANQVIGHNVLQIILPKYRAAFIALTKQVFVGGTANLEFEIQGLKGTHRWLDTHAVPLRDAEGNITALLSVTRDITERKRAQQTQQEVLERLEKIASSVPGMVYQFRLNPDGSSCFPYASPAIKTIYRVTPEEVRDSAANVFTILHPEDYEQVVASINASAQHLTPWQHEYRTRFEDGSERWLLGNAMPERQADGSTLWHGFITDITERKQASQKLQKSEEQLQLVLAGGYLGFWDWNLLTNEVERNVIWAEMLGYTYEEIKHTTQQWEDFVYLDDRERAWQSIDNALKGDTQYHEAEYRMLHKDGSIRWILDHASVVQRDTHGQPIRMTGTHTDITQLKRMQQQLSDSEVFISSILDSLTAHIVVLNSQGEIMAVNNAWRHFAEDNGLPKNSSAMLGVNYLTTCQKAVNKPNGEEASAVQKGIIDVLAGTRADFHIEYPCHSINEKRWFYMSVTHLQGVQQRVVISHENITQRKLAETQLRIAATVFESHEGMFITDANRVILNVNQSFTRITGYSAAEAIGNTPRLLRSGRHDKQFYDALWQSLHDKGVWQGEVWNRRKNGEIYPEWLTITAAKSNNIITHYVATLADITERKVTENHINQLAFYDPLTQLPNRRLLHERIKHAVEVSRRTDSQMAVLMLDLDKFKAVNDNFGHAVGDELLQQVAARIKAHLREVDTVARLGGDEFVVLMEEIEHPEHVAHVADNIIHALSEPFKLCENNDVYIGTSIGIAIHPQHGDSANTLLDNADMALYHAKDEGRSCFAYFSEELTQKARERIALEARLRHAIEQQELHVYFQPQIDINSGRIVGAEALVRWHDPIRGCIPPSEFITLAEETGLIIPLGEFVLRKTCQLGQQWLNDGLPVVRLAVNVSPYQFRRCDINALVSEALHESGFPASSLELEITESGLMDNQQHAMAILNNLHNQGIHLAIDDFGTGYSSLAYLKYFPVDVLKIDKTFIDDIPFLEGDMAITEAIISMAHHLGFKVLAEGVETIEQLAFLREHGCDMYQGYFCSKPVPADDFAKLLSAGGQLNSQ